jgi:hypothetical protein
MIICHKCKSDDIDLQDSKPAVISGLYREMHEARCNNCGQKWRQAGAVKDKKWFQSFTRPVFNLKKDGNREAN